LQGLFRADWVFNDQRIMTRRFASINDLPIGEAVRLFPWPLRRRPDDHPVLSALGLKGQRGQRQ
jgi:nuclear transport factor 2 (NTF2) superfamily protein